MHDSYERQRQADTEVVAGFLYNSEYNAERDNNVCRIIDRAAPDLMFGIEPRFVIQFPDGAVTEALSHQLSPWYQAVAS